MPQQKSKKAVVATVNYAGYEFPGLKLPDGRYAIAVSQVVELFQRTNGGFQFAKDHANRDIKYLLGKDFQFAKSASEINPKKVNLLTLEQFGELVFHVAFRANEVAKAILKASVTTTIEQAFDIAFEGKRSLEEYNTRLNVRVESIVNRRILTNAIEEYIKDHLEEVSANYIKWIHKNSSDTINRIVFGRSAKKLREAWGCKEVRDALKTEELIIIANLERLAATLIEEHDYEPLSAVKEAGNKMLIKQIER